MPIRSKLSTPLQRRLSFRSCHQESYMYKAMDHQGFYYALIFRSSSERYMSHYRHVARASTKLHFVHPGPFEMWWTHQADNWSVRMICGPDCATDTKIPNIQGTMGGNTKSTKIVRFDHVSWRILPHRLFDLQTRLVGQTATSPRRIKRMWRRTSGNKFRWLLL
jgi:hypothetical protein